MSNNNQVGSFFIPGNTPSSKNSRRWTGKYFIVSKTTARWHKSTKGEWLRQRDEFIRLVSNLTKPYYIELTFVRDSKRRFDYINIAQAVFDQMVTYGWLNDDDADNIKPYFGDYMYDKRNPGVHIKILTEKPIHYDNQTFLRTS